MGGKTLSRGWALRAALSAIPVVTVACGSTTTVTVTTPAATSSTATPATQQQLPYDPEEDAFMGHFAWTNGADTSTGCLAEIDDQAACDCAYRRLRADGYPASQLAAVGSGITIESNLPAHDPAWMATTINACSLGQNGGSS